MVGPPQHPGHLFGYLREKDISSYMADVYYLKVIAIVNRSSSEGPSGHTSSVFIRKDESGYQTTYTVKLTYLRVIYRRVK